MTGAAGVLAGAFLAGLRAEGLEPDPELRLLRAGTDGAPEVAPAEGPHALGSLHERLVDDHDRTRRGAWYTPRWLADDVVALVLPDRAAAERGPVLDPTSGGGAFLLAAADRLETLGYDRSAAVHHLRGGDIDPTAVAVAEAALWWWSARSGTPARAGRSLREGDALTDHRSWPASGSVVGNPPFLGQLRSTTTIDADRRTLLRSRFGAAVRPYTDAAWLFLLAATEAVAAGGRVALVQPQSLLGARDAAAVRQAIDRLATLVGAVFDDGKTFDAGVTVCVPVLERLEDAETPAGTHPRNDWIGPLADARGVPRVTLPPGPRLDEVADVHAGFREEYYGLVGAVSEGGDGPRLVTAGAIDPFGLLDRPQRFAGRRWHHPTVDVELLEGRAARWAVVQQGPKLLVATQTQVVEAVADEEGELLGSVPVLCVRPHDPARLWHLLAALQAPAVSAWVLRRTSGTALSSDACKPTTTLLCSLPLPVDHAAWDRAADAARVVAHRRSRYRRFAQLADRAYGIDDPRLGDWWDARRPLR